MGIEFNEEETIGESCTFQFSSRLNQDEIEHRLYKFWPDGIDCIANSKHPRSFSLQVSIFVHPGPLVSDMVNDLKTLAREVIAISTGEVFYFTVSDIDDDWDYEVVNLNLNDFFRFRPGGIGGVKYRLIDYMSDK